MSYRSSAISDRQISDIVRMFKITKRHFSEGDFLFATFIEFVKCWGSGRRSRLFMESRKSGAFMNFSTFLGHPGMRRSFQQSKMASDEEPKVQDPKSKKEKKSKKKSKKKTERDNQRAAIFQKRKKDEAETSRLHLHLDQQSFTTLFLET